MNRLVVAALLLAGCSAELTSAEAPRFVERGRDSGIDFKHVRAATDHLWLPEIMGSGVALFDYDGDSDLDLYCVQSGDLDAVGEEQPGNRLYRNDGALGFEDVTASAGVGDRGYGMGCATGDFDADGDVDLYVTNLGANVLYENLGDGRFRDVTVTAGVGDEGWGTSAAFVDYDADGDLDLFVVNYLEWSADSETDCERPSGQRDYCSPKSFDAAARDVLYENKGDGQFVDVSVERGFATAFGNGLGVALGDFDDDGRMDLYVANDGTPNQLWIQSPDGVFADKALLAGCAVDMNGMAEAGMGAVAVDVDQDGDLDLFMTHLTDESNTFYLNESGRFSDDTLRTGMYRGSLPFTSFGVGFADFDLDGQLDLYVVNGRVSADAAGSYEQRDQLFRGLGEKRFEESALLAGTAKPQLGVSRGAAFGDVDSDGDIDLCVLDNGGGVRLLMNEGERVGKWARFVVKTTRGSDALGARLAITCGARTWWRTVESAYGYLSAHDPRVHCGIGDSNRIDSVRVLWLDGSSEEFGPFDAGREYVLHRGAGR